MLDQFDDKLRDIADNFAEPEKKGELLQVLKQLKKDIIQETIHKLMQGVEATVNDIEVHYLDKGYLDKSTSKESKEE